MGKSQIYNGSSSTDNGLLILNEQCVIGKNPILRSFDFIGFS